MRVFVGKATLFALLSLGVLLAPTSARTQVIYNDLTTVNGFQANGGATSAAGNTSLLADDITFLTGSANKPVTSFTIAIGNSLSDPTNATLTVEFFMASVNGGPGTLLASYSTGIISFAGGVTDETFAAPNLFAVPAGNLIWAGIYFTGAAGTSLTALNNLGAETENPPSIGSSNPNTAFMGTGPATGASNPSGSVGVLLNSQGTQTGQPANLGMAFSVPEPTSWACVGLGAGLLALMARRRRVA